MTKINRKFDAWENPYLLLKEMVVLIWDSLENRWLWTDPHDHEPFIQKTVWDEFTSNDLEFLNKCISNKYPMFLSFTEDDARLLDGGDCGGHSANVVTIYDAHGDIAGESLRSEYGFLIDFNDGEACYLCDYQDDEGHMIFVETSSPVPHWSHLASGFSAIDLLDLITDKDDVTNLDKELIAPFRKLWVRAKENVLIDINTAFDKNTNPVLVRDGFEGYVLYWRADLPPDLTDGRWFWGLSNESLDNLSGNWVPASYDTYKFAEGVILDDLDSDSQDVISLRDMGLED